MTQYCPTCASAISPGARFCSTCGTAIVPKEPASQPTETDEGYARFYSDNPAGAANPQQQPAQQTASPIAANPATPHSAGVSYSASAASAFGNAAYQDGPTAEYQGGGYEEESSSRSFWPWLAGIAFLIAGAIGVYGYMQDGRGLTPISDDALNTEIVDEKTSATIINPRVTLYAAADANVRDKPTTAGTKIVSKITRGSAVQGDVVAGTKGDQWLKLEGQEAYVSLINLVKDAPPRLVSTEAADATIKNRCTVLERPQDGAPVKVTLDPGAKVRITGLTDTGYVEMGLPRGGSGYAAENGAICFQAATPPEEMMDDTIPTEGEQPIDEPASEDRTDFPPQ